MARRKLKTAMRRFVLRRIEDVSGTSGTGIVAEGVVFTNGYCALTWLTPLSSLAFYHSIDVIEKIHGHENRTVLEYIDS